MDLIEKQAALQKEAHEVLKNLDLLNFLSKFGKPQLVGSLISGLMVWPDIDIEVIEEPREEDLWETARYLFHLPGVRSVTVSNYVVRKGTHMPRGYYMGISYKKEENDNKWKIDLWFKNPIQAEADVDTDWTMFRLTDEKRKIILEIKNEVYSNPKYARKFYSTDIYRAVLEKGVKNLEEFKKYLKESGREL